MITVLSVENMRRSDALTVAAGTPGRELMLRAGKAIFGCAEWKAPVAVVCGSGNNAGDGYVLAKLLREACTACEVFVLIRSISSERTRSISLAAKALDSRNTPMPIISLIFRLLSTVPVIWLYTRGSIMPMSVAASVARTIRITSLFVMLFFMYSSRSGIPSFFIGKGR